MAAGGIGRPAGFWRRSLQVRDLGGQPRPSRRRALVLGMDGPPGSTPGRALLSAKCYRQHASLPCS